MKIRRGTLLVGKSGWYEAGKVGIALGKPIFVGQEWVPMIWRDEEDPTFCKMAGLEVLVVKLPAAQVGGER